MQEASLRPIISRPTDEQQQQLVRESRWICDNFH